jgi:hypothetical protein
MEKWNDGMMQKWNVGMLEFGKLIDFGLAD